MGLAKFFWCFVLLIDFLSARGEQYLRIGKVCLCVLLTPSYFYLKFYRYGYFGNSVE